MIKNPVKRFIGLALFYINLAIAVALGATGAFLLFNQVSYWLKEGVWQSKPLRGGLEYLGVLDPDKMVFENWVGISMIAEWFLDFHVALVCIPLGLIMGLSGEFIEVFWFENDQERETNG